TPEKQPNNFSLLKKIEQFTRTYFWAVIVIEIIIIFGIGWFTLLRPTYETLTTMRTQGYTAAQEQLEQQKTYLQNLQSMKEQFSHLQQERLQQLHTVVPTGFDAPQTITAMQAFAEVAHVQIVSIDVVQSQITQSNNIQGQNSVKEQTAITNASDTALRTATITLNLKREDKTYEGLKQFLHTLESTVPILDLENLSYTADTDSFALQLRTYYKDHTTTQ
ncbi:MAG TPA: hypothetical protein VJB65_03775, partial [Patescibacteria group bacterium]|nr:hypothetical protein [Patescibacteria group bacterium]